MTYLITVTDSKGKIIDQITTTNKDYKKAITKRYQSGGYDVLTIQK